MICTTQHYPLYSCIQEELQKKLKKAIKEKDEDSFRYHLSGLRQLLKDDNRMKELLDGSLAYAAYTGFQPAVETLIQKVGGKKSSYWNYHYLEL